MNEQSIKRKSPLKRRYTQQEKENYCRAFEESNLTQILFCQEHGISKSALSKWLSEFKSGKPFGFSPVILSGLTAPPHSSQRLQLEIHLSEQIKFQTMMSQDQLISFICELAHAIAITR